MYTYYVYSIFYKQATADAINKFTKGIKIKLYGGFTKVLIHPKAYNIYLHDIINWMSNNYSKIECSTKAKQYLNNKIKVICY